MTATEPQHEPSAVGHAYAAALLGSARDAGRLDAVAEQVNALGRLLHEQPDLGKLFETPTISDADREGLIDRVFGAAFEESLVRLLKVMSRRNRLDAVGAMTAAFALQLSEERGQLTVDAYVAAPLDDAARQRVREGLSAAMNKDVTVREHVDESLIGGLKFRIGDTLIDASVAAQLRAMQRQLVEAGRERARQVAGH